jgi:CMD domain protein
VSTVSADTAPDLIDSLAGLAPGSSLSDLRRLRPAAVEAIEGSRAAIFAPDASTIPVCERAAVAAHVAQMEGAGRLAEHYRMVLANEYGDDGAAETARLDAMIRHAERLVREPIEAKPEHLAELAAVGLTPRDIVVLSQLIAFVTYETRLLAGLALLKG